MTTSENSPADWLRTANARMQSADILFANEGASEAAVEILHEAAERFLKGFLIQHGWRLRRIHDLGALVAEAEQFDPQIGEFAEWADQLTDQFWAQHYPGGDLSELGENYEAIRDAVGRLAARIDKAST